MKVAAVVPHWNRRDLLQTLLANLAEQTRPFDEIIVVDNGSTDDSAAVAERAGVRVIRLDRNLGFAAAVNRGIASTQADWIAILNNDVTLAPDWLEQLLDAAEKEQAWFATGKTLMAGDPSRIGGAHIDGTFDAISRGACAYRCGSGKPDGPFWNQPRRISMAPMTAALFQRRLFEEIGTLDESFESYLEDVDFGIRCAIGERWGVYVPVAIACHLGSSTWGQWNKYSVRLIARNQLLLTAKHFRGLPRWPILAGQLLWGLVAVCHGCAGAYLQGKMAGMRDARSIPSQRPASENSKALTKIIAFVQESERTILEVQRQTGFDRYWRVYFWLQGL
ncbi:MAG: glycosyltransferase family 2 protein [Acidobacteriia bacterium]|nr:glycosyltransferase family 2 protein [Terriglobia bacterium]